MRNHIVIRQRTFLQRLPKRTCHLIGVEGRSLSAVLVGQLNVFEHEITGDDVCDEQKPLQTLLKVSRFSEEGDKTVHTAVLAAGGELPPDLHAAQPGLVVFDGVTGFRHWRETWRGTSWLVVLIGPQRTSKRALPSWKTNSCKEPPARSRPSSRFLQGQNLWRSGQPVEAYVFLGSRSCLRRGRTLPDKADLCVIRASVFVALRY